MHFTLLVAHSILRWFVLLAALLAVAKMLAGCTRAQAWTPADRRAALVYTISLDVQVLLGVVLYAVSPLTRVAMHGVGSAMKDPDVRFVVAEHPAAMLLAVALAHAGVVMARKAPTDRARFGRAAICFVLSLALILVGMPWGRLVPVPP